MSTPPPGPKIGLRRRISDSEAFIFIAETWRQLVIFAAVTAFVLWVALEDDRFLRAGVGLSALFAVAVVVEWWLDRPKPLPKPKPPPSGD